MKAKKVAGRKRKARNDQPARYRFERAAGDTAFSVWVEYVPERSGRVPIRCEHGPGNAHGGRCIVTDFRDGMQFHIDFMGLVEKFIPADEAGFKFLEAHGIGRLIYEKVDPEIRGATG